MNILFIGCLYSEDKINCYIKNSKRGLQFAAQNLQNSLIEGFDENGANIEVLTIPSLSSFPRSYKSPIVLNGDFIYKNKNRGKSVGYVNLPLFRFLTSAPINYIKEWVRKNQGDNHIFVYGVHKQLMALALKSKKSYPNLKLTLIVPDLPQYFGWNKYYQILRLDKKYSQQLLKQAKEFDRYILLSEHMREFLSDNVKTTNYIVVEGIYSSNVCTYEKKLTDKKIILYTGNISKRYGIEELINAFTLIGKPNYELWIRGDGDLKDFVISCGNSDNRIKYINRLSKEELMKIQRDATLLVNPVSPRQEFTRYFFPSKTMDYLASGTPVLMHKLDCLPYDYYPYLYFFSNESTEDMAKDMEAICEKPYEELRRFGEKAEDFVLTKKNPRVRVKEIIEFMKS